MKKMMLCLVAMLMTGTLSAQEITGPWSGSMSVSGIKLRLVFHIQQSEQGLSATLDSPDQGAKGIPCDTVTFNRPALRIVMRSLGASYDAVLANDTLKGTFSQVGMKIPLDMVRNDTSGDVSKRPQEPHPPFPYYTEEVTFVNLTDNITLAGTLTLPAKDGKYPVVVLISGSGPQNRDEELMGHKPFLVIADYLTRNGIGVLRYDDRGTAQSGGRFSTATSSYFSNDAEAAVEYLRTRHEVDSLRIGLIGHSEGGVIAPMVAARNKRVSFIVMLAGVGVPGHELVKTQVEDMAKASGVPDSARKIGNDLMARVCDLILTCSDREHLLDSLTACLRQSVQTVLPGSSPEEQDVYVQSQVKQMLSPWMQYFLRYDPAPTLRKVACPVLALNGTKDTQVAAQSNLSAIRKALEEGGNTDVTVRELPGLNHLFQECTTGALNEYATIEQTFSPLALEIIVAWIKERK
ncbi:MAG: alpha/beta hydrolase family protein [Tannerella sp.]|uniref:alpha/beta hydrolase family protein n=1 Tax=Tannerella sp. TaxID=2382127 RepID=UPI003FA1AE5F